MHDDIERGRIRRPPPPDNSGSNAVKIILIVLGSILVIGGCLTVGLVGLVIYGARKAGQAVSNTFNETFERSQTQSRYDTVARALEAYNRRNGHYPPPSLPTRNGKPGLSWRVAILPDMGRDDLYLQFKIDETWDHPDNIRMARYAPSEFTPSGASTADKTHLRVFVGPGSMFEYGKMARTTLSARNDSILLSDGAENTITFVEATQSVLWIEPNELPYSRGGKQPQLGMPGNDWFYVATADGRGRILRKDIARSRLEASITAAGGELLRLDGP